LHEIPVAVHFEFERRGGEMAAFEEVGICPELITACEELGWSLYVAAIVCTRG
jgi:hypothetical protein